MAVHSVAASEGGHSVFNDAAIDTMLNNLADGIDRERLYASDDESAKTFGELAADVTGCVQDLAAHGVSKGSRVLVTMPNTLEHIVVILALIRQRAIWIPISPEATPQNIEHIRRTVGASHAIEAGAGGLRIRTFVSESVPGLPEQTRAVMFTSGTTGRPKGVVITGTMLAAAVEAVTLCTEPRDGDRFLLWEPIHHIGGAQMIFLPFVRNVSLVVRRRFSASNFWADVARHHVTHAHYLGGVLDILLKREPSAAERRHSMRVAWGAGARASAWAAARDRFGVSVRECYGSTETSSIVAVNTIGPECGVGKPLPWFDVTVDSATDPDRRPDRGDVRIGEIIVSARAKGVITPGYVGEISPSARAGMQGAWRTKDYGYITDNGCLHFSGRDADRLRVRGENVSAREVEQTLMEFPDIQACAVVGIPSEIGEDELVAFVVMSEAAESAIKEVNEFASRRLSKFQMPSSIRVVNSLPRSTTGRVAKHVLKASLAETATTNGTTTLPG